MCVMCYWLFKSCWQTITYVCFVFNAYRFCQKIDTQRFMTWNCSSHYLTFLRGIDLCYGNPPVTHGFSSQGASNVFGVYLNLLLNKEPSYWVIWDAMALMWYHCKDDLFVGEAWSEYTFIWNPSTCCISKRLLLIRYVTYMACQWQ